MISSLLGSDPYAPDIFRSLSFRIRGRFTNFIIHPLKRYLHITLAFEAWEFLSPLYQENAVAGDKVVESQGLQLAGRINSVKIDMKEIGLGTAVFVDRA